MAQVARGSEPQSDIDDQIDYQFRAWGSIPEYDAWWPTMEAIDREVFHLEWVGITEARLLALRRAADDGQLTPEQRERYAALLLLVDRLRPMLDRLLAT
jgi:hypothetical protein